MNDYIVQTKYAATSLIDLIRAEENSLITLETTLAKVKEEHQNLYSEFLYKDLSIDGDFSDTHIMHAYAKQYSFREKFVEPLDMRIQEINSSISSKQESIDALSGALLQIAKQGIGMVHNGLGNCPSGRTINNEPIKNIIWQARNQSMHFEEGNYHPPVIRCFNNIGITLGNKNLAKEILDLLGWNFYDDYENDLLSLLG